MKILQFVQKPRRLTRVDVTHRCPLDPGVVWLVSNGFRLKVVGGRVWAQL